MKKISKMTWIKIILSVLVIGVMVFYVCKWSITLDPPAKAKPVVKTEAPKVISEKEAWLQSITPNSVDLVKIIDSIQIDSVLSEIWVKSDAYWERIPDVTRTFDGIWEEVQPEDRSWSENIYNEESGELLKTITFKSHIGNAYLRSIIKEDDWRVVFGNEGGFIERKYVLQYGILLKPDTIDKKIYPAGTYVMFSHFLSEREFDRSHKEFKYFSDYEKFTDNLFEQVRSSKEFFAEIPQCVPAKIYVKF